MEIDRGRKRYVFRIRQPCSERLRQNSHGSFGGGNRQAPNKVTMEGHTDSKPFTSGTEYSNWELSADRANAARRWMQDHGMRHDQVTQVRGFADQSLRDPAHPDSASNRRITLIIQYQRPPGAQKQDGGSKPPAPAAAKPAPSRLSKTAPARSELRGP